MDIGKRDREPGNADHEGHEMVADLALQDAIVNAPAAAAVEPAPFDSVGWVDEDDAEATGSAPPASQ